MACEVTSRLLRSRRRQRSDTIHSLSLVSTVWWWKH